MRTGIVLTSFLPFLYYATKDAVFHFRGRRVSLTEHLLHLAIGLSLVIVVVNAVTGQFAVMLAGLVFFAIAGGIDEYVWHRGLPEVESDLHAKEHLALLLFVVVTLVVHWFDNHGWRIPRELIDQRPGPAGRLAPVSRGSIAGRMGLSSKPAPGRIRTARPHTLRVSGVRDSGHHP